MKTSSTADALGVHLQYYRPFIFTHNVPDWVMTSKSFLNVAQLARGKKIKDMKGFKITNLGLML